MKIIYFKTNNSTFVNIDRDILTQHFNSLEYYINMQGSIEYFFALFKLIFFLITKGRKADIYFIRFADWHTVLITFFKKIYKKKFVIVNGGYDVMQIKGLNYGGNNSKFRSWCIRYSLNNADYLLPNSRFLINNRNEYSTLYQSIGGIKYFAPNTKAKIKVIPNGFKIPNDFPIIEKENMVLTIAIVDNLKRFMLKGIDDFIAIARQLHSSKFYIIGIKQGMLESMNIETPSNLIALPTMPYNEIVSYYRKAKVFCLLSLSEGMPNVLCEAMAHKCIPVGTNVSSIPEIIADTGYVINKKNIDLMVRKVNLALESDLSKGELARKRIINNFSLEKREKELVNFINSID